MIGAGHMADMNNRIKQNRALKKSQRNKFKGNSYDFPFIKKSGRHSRPLSAAERAQNTRQGRRISRFDSRKLMVVLGIFIAVLILVSMLLG